MQHLKHHVRDQSRAIITNLKTESPRNRVVLGIVCTYRRILTSGGASAMITSNCKAAIFQGQFSIVSALFNRKFQKKLAFMLEFAHRRAAGWSSTGTAGLSATEISPGRVPVFLNHKITFSNRKSGFLNSKSGFFNRKSGFFQ